jgi:hypothetical protein
MDKLILCLANSYKHGGRCIAGVEVELKDGNLSIVKSQYGIPNWIRPVSHSAAGEVPMCDARDINVLSVVKIHGVSYAGNGSHSEDYYYQSLEPMQSLNPSDTFLKKYTDTWHSTIFGNRGRALTPEAFENGDYSVMLIRTEGAEVYLDTRYEPKPRIKFTHNRNTYDFPITDPIFLDRLHCNDSLYHDNYGVLYIVTSLGVVHDGWHSKLAATIITPATSNIKETVTVQPTRPAQTPHTVQPKTGTTSSGTGPYVVRGPSVTTQKTLYETLRESNVTIPTQRSSSSYNTTPNRPSSSSNSGGCYIATSIYGSYDCPEVWTLRRFRDNTLSQSYMGRLFIRTYYATSPKLVKWFGKYSSFKCIFKPVLDKLVSSLKDKGYESTPYTDR